jgi:hypothetical protein
MFGPQFERLPVQPGIFPAGVVDEVPAMHPLEAGVAETVGNAHAGGF